ncbi:phosphate ABC transporter permease PstA [Candidatus Bathyarchaeota archaeon]|nr:phosphate ABC transporter permease PstA [Candidatus Bathyarchaeota archaeon]
MQSLKEKFEDFKKMDAMGKKKVSLEIGLQGFLLVMAIVAVIAIFFIIGYLFYEGSDIFLSKPDFNMLDFLSGRKWDPHTDQYGAYPLILGTLMVAGIALLIAVPLGLGTAIFIAVLAPPKVHSFLKATVELLAGIPSVVFGFFGRALITEKIKQFADIPSSYSVLASGIVIGFMALPTIVSVSEDAISTVPRAQWEGSLAMGATKWQTIRNVILPNAASGISASIVLGLGRAIGETMAVVLIIGQNPGIPTQLTDIYQPFAPITAIIAIEMAEAAGNHRSALFGLGVILFLIVLIINISANKVMERLRKKSRGEIGKATERQKEINRERILLFSTMFFISAMGVSLPLPFFATGMIYGAYATIVIFLYIKFRKIQERKEKINIAVIGISCALVGWITVPLFGYILSIVVIGGGITIYALMRLVPLLKDRIKGNFSEITFKKILVAFSKIFIIFLFLMGFQKLFFGLMDPGTPPPGLDFNMKEVWKNERIIGGNLLFMVIFSAIGVLLFVLIVKGIESEKNTQRTKRFIKRFNKAIMVVLLLAFAYRVLIVVNILVPRKPFGNGFLEPPFLPIYWAIVVLIVVFMIASAKTISANVKQTIAYVIISSAITMTFLFIIWIVSYIIKNGAPVITWDFLTKPLRILPVEGVPTAQGGIRHAIVGSLYLMVGSIAIAVPIGILAAVYLNEYSKDSWLKSLIRAGVDNLNGTPSIVFGLFGWTFFVRQLGFGESMLSMMMTLALMILPTIIKTTEEALKAIPHAIREGSYGMGATKWQTIGRVTLPSAIPGVITGVILGMGRSIGETAPIMFTGATRTMNSRPRLGGRTMALTYSLYGFANMGSGGTAFAAGTALVLLIMIIGFYTAANIIRHFFNKKLRWQL